MKWVDTKHLSWQKQSSICWKKIHCNHLPLQMHLEESMLALIGNLKSLEIYKHEICKDLEMPVFHLEPSLCLLNQILAIRPSKLKRLWIKCCWKSRISYPVLRDIVLSSDCQSLVYCLEQHFSWIYYNTWSCFHTTRSLHWFLWILFYCQWFLFCNVH